MITESAWLDNSLSCPILLKKVQLQKLKLNECLSCFYEKNQHPNFLWIKAGMCIGTTMLLAQIKTCSDFAEVGRIPSIVLASCVRWGKCT